MLYIKSISDYTVQFTGSYGEPIEYSKDLVANSDELDRVWIKQKYTHGNVLNSCEVSEISLWDGSSYVVYATAEEFVSAFNLMVNNQPFAEVTTTTTTA